MSATNRSAQGIRGVVRFGNGLKPQNDPYHILYLGFIRCTSTNHSLFDDPWGKFLYRKPLLSQGHTKHPPGFRYRNGAAYISGKIKGFHSRFSGFIGLQNPAELFIYKKKPFFMRTVCPGFYTPVGNISKPLSREFNNPPPGRSQPGINPDNTADFLSLGYLFSSV
jgi:hypothetical protein